MDTKREYGYVAHYLNEFGKMQSETKGRLIFRGLTNKEYEVISSAGRRLRKEKRDKQSDFIRYHINLVENARKYGYGVHQLKKELSDVEILAEIQHYGGATCLTDFSTNFLIALWFATRKGKSKADGKVVWIDLGEEANLKLITYYNEHRNEKTIQQILARVDSNFESRLRKVQPIYWLWDPTKLNNRITKQDSVFLFSLRAFPKTNPDLPCNESKEINLFTKSLIIKQDEKEAIRKELEVFFGISAETLFYDFSGYSLEANGAEIEVSENLLSNKECLFLAKENIKKGKYSLAVSYLDDAMKCKRMNGARANRKQCSRNPDRSHVCDTSVGKINFWRACANYGRGYEDEAAMNYFEATRTLTDSEYLLKCEAYRKLSVLGYEKGDLNAALKADKNLWDLYKSNREKGISDEDGIDGIFGMLELAIMQLDEERYRRYLYEAMSIENVTERPDNGRILVNFLKTMGDMIFSRNKEGLQEGYQMLLKEVEDILSILDEKDAKREEYVSVVGYYYWNYDDFINWIRKISAENCTENQFKKYIAENADELILLAKKAADGQNKLLNRVFSKSVAFL